MKNFVQEGATVKILAVPYAVASGAGCFKTAIFGIAANDVANGADGDFVVEGVFDITALSTDTFAAGDKVYWDDTNKRCTSTASGNKLIGNCVDTAKISGDTTVRCRLNAISI